MPSSIGSVEFSMKKSFECSTKPRLGFDRPALEHLHAAGARRKLDQVGGRDHVELHQQVGEADVRRRLVDDDAHGAFGGMGANVNHAAGEAVVAHGRHRDQHLPVEIAAPWSRRCLCLGLSARPDRLTLTSAVPCPLRIGLRSRFVILAGLSTEFHGEMLPHWLPIANDETPDWFISPQSAAGHDRFEAASMSLMCLSPGPASHRRAHDEFNGARKVSPAKAMRMMSGSLHDLPPRRSGRCGASALAAVPWRFMRRRPRM